MAWVNWTRKSPDASVTREPLGVDLNAGRARAAHGRAGRNKLYPLDDPRPDLALGISLEKRTPEVGGFPRRTPPPAASRRPPPQGGR